MSLSRFCSGADHGAGVAEGGRAAGVVRQGRLRQGVGARHAALLPDRRRPPVRQIYSLV